ncbi:MAG: hypothetical protein IKG18_15730 [Atopobiaceae bacterium]|nr:hypothetical protein [Atopobiaceae bacterium]MBR3315578.1 hypothetical protein [Atopobiaceae bacterium]
MAKRTTLRDSVLAALGRTYALKQEDLGADACLSAKGMTFETEGWEIPGVGHLCVMQMAAFLGLMRMETVVVAPTDVDFPLFNLDWVKAFGIETQIAELYDTQLQPWPDECHEAFEFARDRYADLPDAPAGDPHWYDGILYPCSFHKKGRGLTERMSRAAQDYLTVYVELLAAAPACNPAEKAAKVQAFAERLFEEGGPAVDQVTKLFGEQTARRLILRYMYGVNPSE